MADYGLDITAQSLPDYDEWGPDQHWGCTDWMVWYDKLKEEYGKNEARVVWKSAWEKQGYWDAPYNECPLQDSFRTFSKKNKLDSTGLFSDFLVGISDTASGAFKSVGWLGRNLPWILPVGLVITGSFYVIKTIKTLRND
tara:strand:- start:5165 stop:5584 length:420 start_codon:yes stop_codon:yes gene_type:complete